MQLDVISYEQLLCKNTKVINTLKSALLNTGIVGISNVPEFAALSRDFINVARKFAALPEKIKQQYIPDRDAGQTQGYELSAERFLDNAGQWQIDDKKASYYACVPDQSENTWPSEMDLKTAYLQLGQLIFGVGKNILNLMNLNESLGLAHEHLAGCGRMLHYHKENSATDDNPHWCGAHFDHGIFTGLIPAYYFCNGEEVSEPADAGLFIVPSDGHQFQKVHCPDKTVLLFQVGEFGQLVSNDSIKATKHKVIKVKGEVERFTYALFFSGSEQTIITSNSVLTQDARYHQNQRSDGSISFAAWHDASLKRYRAIPA